MHSKRVMGYHILTYEEFNTFLVQVKSILNLRSLLPLRKDLNDLSVLTPGYFLTFELLNVLSDYRVGGVAV